MDDLIAVRLRLQGTRQFLAEAAASAKAVATFGLAGEEAAAKTRIAGAESFLFRQGLFTLRRELFYGTAAAAAFGAEALHLGFAFDEAQKSGLNAFTAITGSTRVAGREMTTLVSLTHQTGLQLGTLVSTAEQMQGFGFTLRQVNSYMAALASFAERAGRGTSGFAALVEVFDRIRQSGRLTSLDIRSLTAQGVPALAILTRQLHLSGLQSRLLRAGRLVIPAQYALPALAAGIGARAGQLGTGLGQQVGIARSYLAQILGGGEQGVFSFATRGLERGNAAFKSSTGGGSFLGTLDPSGRLILGWNLLTAAIHGAIAPFTVFFRIGTWVGRQLPFLAGGLGVLAKQTWLVKTAMVALATWYGITRTRMILMWTAEKVLAAFETGYLVVLYALDAATALFAGELGAAAVAMDALNLAFLANPITWLVLGVVALGVGLYELVKHADAVGHAFVVAFGWIRREFRAVINYLIDGLNWFINHLTLGGLWNWLAPKIGLPKIPLIPHLAEGGTVTAPGWSLVGERGPELRYEPRGATIVPLSAATPARGPLAVTVILQLGEEQFARAMVRTNGQQKIIANAVFQAQSAAEGRA